MFETPTGLYVAVYPTYGPGTESEGWTVRVLNFATWKHLKYEFANEAAARGYAELWRI